MSGIFINYRSDESGHCAALIARELSSQLGRDKVFLDSRSIPLGKDFVDVLLGQLHECSVLIVVMGPRWLTLTNDDGCRRIDSRGDWVRREIVEAFACGLRVIPVLTDGAVLPKASDLPADIAGLSRRQCIHLRHRYAESDLEQLVNKIVNVDPDLAQAARQLQHAGGGDMPLPVPQQLPADTVHFTGRGNDLAKLDSLLSLQDDGPPTAVVISAIDGTAGVGKTTLAVHWALQVRKHFPDGQLYVDLRGYDPKSSKRPAEVLDGFLRALNVAATQIPPETEARAALYRSLMDRRRMLVLLDNAATVDQVRPLLPSSPTCLVVVTSRSRLSGLATREGIRRVTLDLLPPDEAVALLRRIVGYARVDAELDIAAELARACACLPLALRIAADRIAASPYTTLADLAAELADEHERLNAFTNEDTALRAVFTWSYRMLPAAAARMFRLLGLHTGPDISTAAASALAGTTLAQARLLLNALTDVHLLKQTERTRYQFHDLLRVYAAERANAEETDQARDLAIRRVLTWYLRSADAAGRTLMPGRTRIELRLTEATGQLPTFANPGQALEWGDAERANLVAATRQAAERGLHTIAWQLPTALWDFFSLRKNWAEWITTHTVGLAATKYLQDQRGEAWILNSMADAHWGLRRFDEAMDYLPRALAISRAAGEKYSEGWALNNLGRIYLGLQRFNEALDHFSQALVISQSIENQWGNAWILSNLGEAYLGLRRFDEALDHFTRALSISRTIGDLWSEAWIMHRLGEVYLDLRRFDDALDHLRQSLVFSRTIGDRYGEAWALDGQGKALYHTGQQDAARESWCHALAVFDSLGDSMKAAEIRSYLADD